MKRFVRYTSIFLGTALVWGGICYLASDHGWYYVPKAENAHTNSFVLAAKNEIEKGFKGSFAMAVLEKGKVKAEFFHSSGKKVDRNTLFQVASLSKMVSAVGVMKLVEEEKIDLDVPVNQYLTRWQLPPSEFNNEEVSTRGLLSHTSGLTDGLGYSGFRSRDSVQTLEASLTNTLDADKGVSGQVKVGVAPNTEWRYSGGGYTLLQLLVEERSQEIFTVYMTEKVLEPLGMVHSYYELPESAYSKLTDFYNADGSEAPHFYYTSLAATSLYSSLADLETFFQEFTPKNNKLLKKGTLDEMQKPIGYKMGVPTYGMGIFLFASLDSGKYIIGHDGMSSPPINTALRINPDTGDGIIFLETGDADLATRLASDWVFVTTGKVDNLLYLMQLEKNLKIFGLGLLVLLLATMLIGIARKGRIRTGV
ncbi:serine hydrolase domain-containing protein [Allomuricauda sp. M10]|uniref:serine hydrolase domain-containing protein n=1 Tax=Allomuricauda sp. M10 TaxID=2683292 RepID=UPI001D18FDAC|nr:serine hydrolase domain-containing protein [Muricauda sp. M10]